MFFSVKKYYLIIYKMEDNEQIEDKRDIQTTEINTLKHNEGNGRKILTLEERKERAHNYYSRRKDDVDVKRRAVERSLSYHAKNKQR